MFLDIFLYVTFTAGNAAAIAAKALVRAEKQCPSPSTPEIEIVPVSRQRQKALFLRIPNRTMPV